MKDAKSLKGVGQYGTIGIEVVLSILFGLFIGTKLDGWLGTKPWMTLVWFGFGCAAAGRAIYRAWKGMQAEAKREEAEHGNPAQAFPDEKSLEWQREEEKAAEEKKGAGARNGSAERQSGGGDGDDEGEKAALENGGDGAKKAAGRGAEKRHE